MAIKVEGKHADQYLLNGGIVTRNDIMPDLKGIKDSFKGVLLGDDKTGSVFYVDEENDSKLITITRSTVGGLTFERVTYEPIDGLTVTIPLFELMYLIHGEGKLSDRLDFCDNHLYKEEDDEWVPSNAVLMPEFYEVLSESGLTITRNYDVKNPVILKDSLDKKEYIEDQKYNKEILNKETVKNFEATSKILKEEDVDRLKYPLRLIFKDYILYSDKRKIDPKSKEITVFNLPDLNKEFKFEDTKFKPNSFIRNYLKEHHNPIQYRLGFGASHISNYMVQVIYDYELTVYDTSKIEEEVTASGDIIKKILPMKDVNGKDLHYSTIQIDSPQGVKYALNLFKLEELKEGDKPIRSGIEIVESDLDEFLKEAITKFMSTGGRLTNLKPDEVVKKKTENKYKLNGDFNTDRDFRNAMENALKENNQEALDKLKKSDALRFNYYMRELNTDKSYDPMKVERMPREKSQQELVIELGNDLLRYLSEQEYKDQVETYKKMMEINRDFTKQFLNQNGLTERKIMTRPKINEGEFEL